MTTEMHKAPSVARNTGISRDNATSVARYDLSTSEGSRRYVSDFFATELRRHDFADYISTRLAADFACALAQHLAATGKQQVGEVQGGALPLAEHITDRLCHHEYDIGGRSELLACVTQALAARQPGAQVPFGWWLEDANGVGYFSRRMQPAALYAHRTTPGYSATPLHAAPPAQGIDQGPGVQAITIERQRQMAAERFTSTHDEQYQRGELAKAAVAYVQLAAMELDAGTRGHIGWLNPPAIWPWEAHWWKPVDARRDLVRAGALIAAQLDLIDQRDSVRGVGNG